MAFFICQCECAAEGRNAQNEFFGVNAQFDQMLNGDIDIHAVHCDEWGDVSGFAIVMSMIVVRLYL